MQWLRKPPASGRGRRKRPPHVVDKPLAQGWGRRCHLPADFFTASNGRVARSATRSLASKLKHTLPIALIFCLLGCSAPRIARVVDPDAASCVPADTIVLAGVDLNGLRAAPIYSKLPPAAVALAGSFSTASSALLAYNGKELLVIARGHFAQAPPGATLASPDLAVFGSPELVAASLAQHRSHATGAPALVALGESIAAGRQIWVVAQGGAPFALTGNAANLNQILRNSETITIAANLGAGLALAVTAIGRSASAARSIEETLRADITLAAAAEARHPDFARLLHSIQIDRDDWTVRITLSADADAAAKLIAALAP